MLTVKRSPFVALVVIEYVVRLLFTALTYASLVLAAIRIVGSTWCNSAFEITS